MFRYHVRELDFGKKKKHFCALKYKGEVKSHEFPLILIGTVKHPIT